MLRLPRYAAKSQLKRNKTSTTKVTKSTKLKSINFQTLRVLRGETVLSRQLPKLGSMTQEFAQAAKPVNHNNTERIESRVYENRLHPFGALAPASCSDEPPFVFCRANRSHSRRFSMRSSCVRLSIRCLSSSHSPLACARLLATTKSVMIASAKAVWSVLAPPVRVEDCLSAGESCFLQPAASNAANVIRLISFRTRPGIWIFN